MTSIGASLKELLELHAEEDFTINGDSNLIFLDFGEKKYMIDFRGAYLEITHTVGDEFTIGEQESSEEDIASPTLPFSQADYPALEKALISIHRLYLDPTFQLEDEYSLWDVDEEETNYLPLGMLDFPGRLPHGWAGDEKDYLKFGVDEEGRLYVDVSYIPLRPVLHHDGAERAKAILEHTDLGKLLTLEEFLNELEEETPWTDNHFGSTEIYELRFEIIEEKDAHTVTPSMDYPLRNLRFPVEYQGKHYSIYPHEHQD